MALETVDPQTTASRGPPVCGGCSDENQFMRGGGNAEKGKLSGNLWP